MRSTHKITLYLERAGGAWECRYWHTDEGRYYRVTATDHLGAIRACAKASGYAVRECRIVSVSDWRGIE